MLKRNQGKIKKQEGLTLLEMLLGLVVLAGVFISVAVLFEKFLEDKRIEITASHLKAVGLAARVYTQEEKANILATIASDPTKLFLITSQMLKDSKILSPTFSLTNPFGQIACALVLETKPGDLAVLAVAEGGESLDDLTLGQISQLLGASGGGIYSSDSNMARGAVRNWEFLIGSFANQNDKGKKCNGTTDGTVEVSGGRNVMATWFFWEGTHMASNVDALSRAEEANTELNTMQTPILMGAGTIVNSGDACSSLGGMGRNNQGRIMLCRQDKTGTLIWQKMDSLYWEDPVTGLGGLPACDGSILGQTRLVKITTKYYPFTCTQSGWRPWVLDGSTNDLTIQGNALAGVTATDTLTVQGNATIDILENSSSPTSGIKILPLGVIGEACSPDGKIARTNTGRVIFCESGLWAAHKRPRFIPVSPPDQFPMGTYDFGTLYPGSMYILAYACSNGGINFNDDVAQTPPWPAIHMRHQEAGDPTTLVDRSCWPAYFQTGTHTFAMNSYTGTTVAYFYVLGYVKLAP